jgi:hypothetical protein
MEPSRLQIVPMLSQLQSSILSLCFTFDKLQSRLHLQCPFSFFPRGGYILNLCSRADFYCNGAALRPYMYSFEVMRGGYFMWILKLPCKRSSCCHIVSDFALSSINAWGCRAKYNSLAVGQDVKASGILDKTPEARYCIHVYRIG